MKSLIILLAIVFIAGSASAEDYSFDISPAEGSEKLEISGNLDAKYSIVGTRRTSPVYRLQFYDRNDLSGFIGSNRLELYLNGDCQTENLDVHIKTHSEYYGDSAAAFKLYELYGNVNLSANSFLQTGKKIFKWGTGYSFNPVGYLNPYKDPENPELSQEGRLSVNYEYIKSFKSALLQNISLTAVLIPPEELINNKYAIIKNTEIAVKLYALLLNADLDLMAYYSKERINKIGFDFSKNIRENMEMHGEFGYYNGQDKYYISNNNVVLSRENGYSYLLGLRWLNKWNATVIVEYYCNGLGLNKDEYSLLSNYLLSTADSGNTNIFQQALGLNKKYFSGAVLMRDYMYFKISLPEPFNIVYFTPSAYVLYNLIDKSYSAAIPLSYKPIDNIELLLWPAFISGGMNTEYGDKQAESKVELWVRYYF